MDRSAVGHAPGSTEQITTVSVAGNSGRNDVDVERAVASDVQRSSTMDWATLMSTPICQENRFAVLSTDDYDDHQQPQELYTTVVNSRRKRPRQRTPEQQRQQQSATTSQQQQAAGTGSTCSDARQ